MPELPEVETTRRGIEPHIANGIITDVIIREHRLRWPIAKNLRDILFGQTILTVQRRGKYLLLNTVKGGLIIHLGMSGNLRILFNPPDNLKHDHIDIIFNHKICLRFNDPRRFGCVLWVEGEPLQHTLLKDLGPEPLTKQFTAQHLYGLSRAKKQAIKDFIMDSHVVVGVGNIYANEALFLAGIRPQISAGKVSLPRYEKLAKQIKFVLKRSITMGGTTLRDFVNSEGKPGYFKQVLNVYDRAGQPCRVCGSLLKLIKSFQRQTVYCPECQK